MPTVSIQATNFSNSGMNSPAVNGHASTTAAWGDPPTGSDIRTIQWDTFPSIPGIVKAVRVRFDWSRSASTTGNGFTFWQITCNNGDTIIQESNVAASGSGSVNFTLTTGFDQPQTLNIFEFSEAAVFISGFGGSAGITTQISNLRLEVDYDEIAHPILLI